jgi:hypothetical protein
MPHYEESPFTWKRYANKTGFENTVANENTYDAFSKWWKEPKCAAMAHESFLHHMQLNNLQAYDFNYWDFHSSIYTRWSINFVLMRGKYVNRMKEWFPHMDDDEYHISQEIPKAVKRHCYSLGAAVVVHFSYFPQFHYLNNTNLLERYEKLSRKYLGL